jgi:hypothetical protein
MAIELYLSLQSNNSYTIRNVSLNRYIASHRVLQLEFLLYQGPVHYPRPAVEPVAWS